ncbi:MAG: 16S rRNA (cytosine(1402)-N(4))-methyltransferase RsmH [Actinomycetaceae bacterium]|nr:16S rRNA (cytosine(1402)-N(4))-methyltransferase RsmH [Actinomycetaceae bacterium]
MNATVGAAGNALHTPVLLSTCLDILAPALSSPDSVLIDCTLGMGGHSEAFLSTFPDVTVIGIDRDQEAIELASERLEAFGLRFQAIHATYDAVGDVAAQWGKDGKVQAILMDLGVSSLQIDRQDRGFSYSQDAPLDMRMDTTKGMSAMDFLAEASQNDIARVLRDYGEERYAGRIAQAIVERRVSQPITHTGELVDIIRQSIPAPARRTGGNPAKRTFQALRIAVNNELEILARAIDAAIDSLALDGHILVMSYHSLEDRIVKRAFRRGSQSSTPNGLPVELAGHEPYLELLTRGAVKASPEEVASNPRSASVRLRAARRIRGE